MNVAVAYAWQSVSSITDETILDLAVEAVIAAVSVNDKSKVAELWKIISTIKDTAVYDEAVADIKAVKSLDEKLEIAKKWEDNTEAANYL